MSATMTKEAIKAASQKFRDDFAARRREMDELAKEYFGQGSKVLFDAFPSLESFSWTQYAPRYNDGEECVFRAHTNSDEIEVNGVEYDDTYDYDRSTWTRTVEEAYADIYPVYDEIADLLDAVGDDTLKAMFGSDVMVTVDRKGVTVDEYTDHS